jgi:hypothetical protein
MDIPYILCVSHQRLCYVRVSQSITSKYMRNSKQEPEPHSKANERLKGGGDSSQTSAERGQSAVPKISTDQLQIDMLTKNINVSKLCCTPVSQCRVLQSEGTQHFPTQHTAQLTTDKLYNHLLHHWCTISFCTPVSQCRVLRSEGSQHHP